MLFLNIIKMENVEINDTRMMFGKKPIRVIRVIRG